MWNIRSASSSTLSRRTSVKVHKELQGTQGAQCAQSVAQRQSDTLRSWQCMYTAASCSLSSCSDRVSFTTNAVEHTGDLWPRTWPRLWDGPDCKWQSRLHLATRSPTNAVIALFEKCVCVPSQSSSCGFCSGVKHRHWSIESSYVKFISKFKDAVVPKPRLHTLHLLKLFEFAQSAREGDTAHAWEHRLVCRRKSKAQKLEELLVFPLSALHISKSLQNLGNLIP